MKTLTAILLLFALGACKKEPQPELIYCIECRERTGAGWDTCAPKQDCEAFALVWRLRSPGTNCSYKPYKQ